MLKISTTILALIMLTISFSKASDNKIPNVHIAYAHLIKIDESCDTEVLTKYQIDSIYKGNFLKDDYVYISIKKEAILKKGLPAKAILILHFQSEKEWYDDAIKYISKDENNDQLRTYVPLQNDAQKGILPDTPENRKKIESLSLEGISRTPVKEQSTMERAIEIAKKKCEEDDDGDYQYRADRYPYGWRISYQEKETEFGGDGLIYVGDDGQIKGTFEGL